MPLMAAHGEWAPVCLSCVSLKRWTVVFKEQRLGQMHAPVRVGAKRVAIRGFD